MTTEEETEKSQAERELEDVLKQMGIFIMVETPEYRSGNATYYRIEASKTGDPDDVKPFVGQGVTRIDALKGVIVMSNAT